MSSGDALTGMRALVTGAASGIGAACVTALHEAGAQVGGVDRADALPGGAARVWARADVADEPELRGAVRHVADVLGGLDVVVGCAGVSGPFGTDVAATELADWQRVLDVNLTGQFLLVKHALPDLRRSPAPAIVFLGSDSAFVAAEGMVPYCAAKGGLAQLTRALAVDLRRDGIRVCSVCPSVVDTPMARTDLGDAAMDGAGFPVQTPEQVARHVAYLASPASASLSGVNLVSDFGYTARSSFPA